METARSADGTPIAYDQAGHGPLLIMVGGAMTARPSGTRPQLAGLLADRFTVVDHHPRGRRDRAPACTATPPAAAWPWTPPPSSAPRSASWPSTRPPITTTPPWRD